MPEYTAEQLKVIEYALKNEKKLKADMNREEIVKKEKAIVKAEKKILKYESDIETTKQSIKDLKAEIKALS